MKFLTVCALAGLVLLPAYLVGAPKTVEYDEVEFEVLKLSPEKYKNKTVTFTEEYHRYSTTFPGYMERSGFKSTKYILLEIGDIKVPAIAKKDDAMTAFIATLTERSKVKVYGKIRKFRVMPERGDIGFAPEYYTEVEKIELIEEAPRERMSQEELLKAKIERLKEANKNRPDHPQKPRF